MLPPSQKLPYDVWSKAHPCCRICNTKSKVGMNKHEARGLCRMCYKREMRPHWKNRTEWDRIKMYPSKVRKYLRRLRHWRNTSKGGIAYSENYKRHWVRRKYQEFIKNWFEHKELIRYGQQKEGVGIYLDYEGEDFYIISPMHSRQLQNYHLEVFREEFNKYMQKNYENLPKRGTFKT